MVVGRKINSSANEADSAAVRTIVRLWVRRILVSGALALLLACLLRSDIPFWAAAFEQIGFADGRPMVKAFVLAVATLLVAMAMHFYWTRRIPYGHCRFCRRDLRQHIGMNCPNCKAAYDEAIVAHRRSRRPSRTRRSFKWACILASIFTGCVWFSSHWVGFSYATRIFWCGSGYCVSLEPGDLCIERRVLHSRRLLPNEHMTVFVLDVPRPQQIMWWVNHEWMEGRYWSLLPYRRSGIDFASPPKVSSMGSQRMFWTSSWTWLTVPIWIVFAALLVPATILWWKDRKPPAGFCRKCGYNITGSENGICSECGSMVPVMKTSLDSRS